MLVVRMSWFSVVDASFDIAGNEYDLFYSKGVSKSCKATSVEIDTNGQSVKMEVDTGAFMTLVSWNMLINVQALAPVMNTTLCTYTGEVIPILGICQVTVNWKQNSIFMLFKGRFQTMFCHD